MKRRLTISLSFALVLMATLAAFHQPVQGQTGNNVRRSRISSGVISINQNQYVRLSLANAVTNPNASDRLTARVQAVIVDFAPNGMQGSVMRQAVVGQTSSGPITLRPGEGATMDYDLSQATRADVQSFLINIEALPFAGSSNAAACVATLTIYDKFSQQPLSVWVWAEADGGYVWM